MRTCTFEEAAALVRPDDVLAMPLGPGQPPGLLDALGKRDDWTSLTVFGAILIHLSPLFTRPGVHYLSGFYGPLERVLEQQGHDVRFVPGDFRRFAKFARMLRPRVMTTCACPPDENGRLSLSLHAGATVEEMRKAGRDPERLLVVEAMAKLPRTYGLPPEHPHSLSVDEVDVLIESDRDPFVLPDPDPSEIDQAIAQHVLRYIRDGYTIQTGIGGIPNAVARRLAEGPGGDYGIHTEMFTTGLMHLHRAGKVSNRHKKIFPGVSVATFALGTPELYEWLDHNEEARFLPVDVVNDPGVIGRNPHMISINGALAVDLAGQIAADTLGFRQHSGIGGHEDFITGAGLPYGSRSLVCLPSTAVSKGRLVSRIQTVFPPGTVVTTPRHQVDVVVTEHGAAELEGRTTADRAAALIEIAHPAFRDALRERVLEMPTLPAEPADAP